MLNISYRYNPPYVVFLLGSKNLHLPIPKKKYLLKKKKKYKQI